MVCVVSFDLECTLVDTFSDMVWNVGLPRLHALKKGLDFDKARRIVLSDMRGSERIVLNDTTFIIGLDFLVCLAIHSA
ncbi:MAG: hypothetical protein QXJ07_05285 [Candidatus Bathyarchaeia archaeon]